ncbi:endo alpha-1,4 polygalactosaminidase [Aspergillus stella-maris]|uniref:endo alpha-1,4 polygalactosaminidase n=1 Tax=Aspergillus stella-maris TaxID=1810926 RepID=UPI003CCDC7FE
MMFKSATAFLALSALTTAFPTRFTYPLHTRPTNTSATTPSSTPTSTSNAGGIWQPPVGATWQIILNGAFPSSALSDSSSSMSVSIFDIDLFENPASTIESLHASGKKVICYFSAGTREDWRDDASEFQDSDLGDGLDHWEGENWLDLRSDNVRSIMSRRLDIAQEKGCDAVDPDNVDAYGNDQGGIGLTEDDSVDFLSWLSSEAHSRGLAIGLKNAGSILPRLVGDMEFSVNEQCTEYNECDVYMPFVRQGKPVFQIEYPKGDYSDEVDISVARKTEVCEGYQGEGMFSTLIKNMDLREWVQVC